MKTAPGTCVVEVGHEVGVEQRVLRRVRPLVVRDVRVQLAPERVADREHAAGSSSAARRSTFGPRVSGSSSIPAASSASPDTFGLRPVATSIASACSVSTSPSRRTISSSTQPSRLRRACRPARRSAAAPRRGAARARARRPRRGRRRAGCACRATSIVTFVPRRAKICANSVAITPSRRSAAGPAARRARACPVESMPASRIPGMGGHQASVPEAMITWRDLERAALPLEAGRPGEAHRLRDPGQPGIGRDAALVERAAR